jgi:uncharacterized membrane protein
MLTLFTVADLVWLGIVARSFYRRELGSLIADKFNAWAAAAFYLMYPMGIVAFAMAPSTTFGAWKDVALASAGLGFFAYATYDLTNLATLRQWPLRLAVVDVLWGTLLTALAATGAYLVALLGS